MPAATEGRIAAPAASSAAREFLTPEEAAEALGIHVQTLRAYVRSGKLPALRVAGERSLRVRRSDLEKVLEPLVSEKP
jgi:excisionase family DNA binding protein